MDDSVEEVWVEDEKGDLFGCPSLADRLAAEGGVRSVGCPLDGWTLLSCRRLRALSFSRSPLTFLPPAAWLPAPPSSSAVAASARPDCDRCDCISSSLSMCSACCCCEVSSSRALRAVLGVRGVRGDRDERGVRPVRGESGGRGEGVCVFSAYGDVLRRGRERGECEEPRVSSTMGVLEGELVNLFRGGRDRVRGAGAITDMAREGDDWKWSEQSTSIKPIRDDELCYRGCIPRGGKGRAAEQQQR